MAKNTDKRAAVRRHFTAKNIKNLQGRPQHACTLYQGKIDVKNLTDFTTINYCERNSDRENLY